MLTTSWTRSPTTAHRSSSHPSATARSSGPYDTDLYKERNRIERFFNKLKPFRRVATRYDKLLANIMGFGKLAAIAIWLR
jgi:putative transposase